MYDWENKMALQQSTGTTLQCKETWYGRQMKYIHVIMNGIGTEKQEGMTYLHA